MTTRRPPSPARVLMVQGAASHAGKSTIVAALCRIFARDGWRVAPFKAQNISLNAAVARGAGEIGVSQAVQARAAGVEPLVEMNPVLVKPGPAGRTQTVVLGRVVESPPPRDVLWRSIARALDTLRAGRDLVVAEGAGSPAEINLKNTDVANMRVARYADAPVLLVGDIDRGGVFAALAGTMALLGRDRGRVRGFIVNKFRGDAAALRPALRDLETRTGRPVLGVVPYAPAWRLPEEDAVALEAGVRGATSGSDQAWLDVAIVQLPYISNFDEFDALEQEAGVRVRYVRPGGTLGRPDLVILPGSKSTAADLAVLRRCGLGGALLQAVAAGAPVLGICGGYQMLGRRIQDAVRVESGAPVVDGLGLLPVVTTFGRTKRISRVRVRLGAPRSQHRGMAGAWPAVEASGYEIHMGRSTLSGPAWVRVIERNGRRCTEPAGAASGDGLICGTAVHGLLGDPAVRHAVLDWLWTRRGGGAAEVRAAESVRVPALDDRLDGLADLVARHVDIDRVRAIARLPRR